MGRRNLRAWRRAARAGAGVGGLLLVVAAAGPAAAASVRVEHGIATNDDTFTETQLCPFPLTVHEVNTARYTLFFDADGNFVRAQVHVTSNTDLSANGVTVHDFGSWTDFYYPDGTHRKIGLQDHVTGPGGLIQNEAGLIFTVGSDDNIVDFHGHITLSPEPVCSALQP